MFGDLDALVQGVRGVVGEDGNFLLGEYGAGVHAAIHEVDRASAFGGFCFDGLFPGFQTGEGG